jgi:TonB-dependent SusC/RagA subfamily outer membrane receptor
VLVNSNTVTSTEETVTLIQILSAIYVTGVIFFLIRFIIQMQSLRLVLINNEKKTKQRFTLIETSNQLPPFSFFKWIVYNPNQFNDIELNQILTHEKAHAHQYHSIDILISQLATIVLWFNPFIWLYKKKLQQNLEFIADHTANHKANCKKSYQQLLLKTSVPNHQLALTNNFYNSLIKKRIVMLHKNKSQNRNLWKFTFILPLLALFIMSFNTKEIIVNIAQKSPNDSTIKTPEATGEIIEVIISKDSKETDLKLIKADFKKVGVTLKFSGIKRNDNNEIIAIKAEFKSTEGNSGNFILKGDKPIKPFSFHYDQDNGNIGFNGNVSSHDFRKAEQLQYFTKDGKHKIQKSGKGNNTFVFTSDDENENDDDENIFIIEKDGKIHEIKKGNKYINEVRVLNTDTLFAENQYRFRLNNSEIIHSDSIKAIDTVFYVKKDIHVIRGDNDSIIEIKSGENNKHKIFVSKDKNGNVVKEWISDEGDDNDVWVDEDKNTFIIRTDTLKLTTEEKSENKLFISDDDENNALFIVDGKEVSKKDLDVDPNNIASVNVLKGKAATKLYGDKGKDGVIVITTKLNIINFSDKKIKDGNFIKEKGNKENSVKGWINKDGNVFIESDGGEKDELFIKKDSDGKVIIKSSENGELWTGDTDSNFTIKNLGKGKSKIFISGDTKNKKQLFIVDGEEVSKKDLDVDPNNIESVNVLKGKAATKLYGDKGKNGVIVITTKKE